MRARKKPNPSITIRTDQNTEVGLLLQVETREGTASLPRKTGVDADGAKEEEVDAEDDRDEAIVITVTITGGREVSHTTTTKWEKQPVAYFKLRRILSFITIPIPIPRAGAWVGM
jgi:hypothetical protein